MKLYVSVRKFENCTILKICIIRRVPAKIHRIKLLEFERDELETIRAQKRGWTASAMAAVALLLSDEGLHGPALRDLEIREITGLSIRTISPLLPQGL